VRLALALAVTQTRARPAAAGGIPAVDLAAWQNVQRPDATAMGGQRHSVGPSEQRGFGRWGVDQLVDRNWRRGGGPRRATRFRMARRGSG
jgi:hypothetical protein